MGNPIVTSQFDAKVCQTCTKGDLESQATVTLVSKVRTVQLFILKTLEDLRQ